MIVIGTILLLLPISTPSGKTLTITDAFFTATSASCVTGLIVVQTPFHFTWFGEFVILMLFQLGGIGIILASTMVVFGIKGSMGMEQRFALQKTFVNWPYKKIKSVFTRVFGVFFAVEAVGAAIFTWEFMKEMSFGKALWHGIFHSVSAICNAGFSLNPDSLVGYQNNPVVVITAIVLIVVGGIGFIVIAELLNFNESQNRYSLHTKTMLVGTGFFLAIGIILFAILEPQANWLGWIFQSVTARTAGFNTVDIAAWGTSSVLIIMFLMFIGAGPASTAGGVKVTTIIAALADVVSRMKQQDKTHWLNRRLPKNMVNNAVVLIAIAMFLVGFFTFLLTITETAPLKIILFEVVSALGTVGLSLGITMELTTIGKWIIIAAMFIGRLGPLTFALLVINEQEVEYTYAEEDLMIG